MFRFWAQVGKRYAATPSRSCLASADYRLLGIIWKTHALVPSSVALVPSSVALVSSGT